MGKGGDGLRELPAARRWQGQTQPVAVVAGIVRREGENGLEFLLIKRIQEPYVGKWALVGGRWEFGETLAEAVRREIREETSLETEFVALRGCVNERLFPRNEDDRGAHFVIFACEVRALQGEAREQAEGQVSWFSESQLHGLHERQEIAPTDYLILKRWMEASPGWDYIEVEVVVGS